VSGWGDKPNQETSKMNAIAKTENLVRMPVKRENETLLQMTKTIDSREFRRYGTVIGIQSGNAYVTDGFGVLRWKPDGDLGHDRALDPSLSQNESITFPNVSNVWPKTPMSIMSCADVLISWIGQLKPTKKKPNMVLKITERGPTLVPLVDCKAYDGPIFNPALLCKYIKGIPKNAAITSVKFNSEFLLLNFLSDVGEFEILLVSLNQG